MSNAYNLSPENHFGGLKGKNTLDALVILQKKIYQVWKNKKIFSLTIFDVIRIFNWVARDILFY